MYSASREFGIDLHSNDRLTPMFFSVIFFSFDATDFSLS